MAEGRKKQWRPIPDKANFTVKTISPLLQPPSRVLQRDESFSVPVFLYPPLPSSRSLTPSCKRPKDLRSTIPTPICGESPEIDPAISL